MNPKSTDCEADALTTTPLRRFFTPFYVVEKGPCEMSTNALRQKSIHYFFNVIKCMHVYFLSF